MHALRHYAQNPVPGPTTAALTVARRWAATMLTVEYPTVQMRRPDLVVRLTDGRLYHLELQSTNDPAMPWRMLEYLAYCASIMGSHRSSKYYMWEAPLTMPARLEYPTLSFQYEPIDIRTLDGTGWHGVAHQPVAGRQFTRALVPSAESAWAVQHLLARIASLGGQPRGCPGQTCDPGRAQAPPSCCTRGDPTDAHHH